MEALRQLGVFNGFVDIDSKLYVDPYLLRTAKVPELQGAYAVYRKYFEDVLRLLRKSSGKDILFLQATKLLTSRLT